jgi:hypothetical protein
VIVVWGGTSLYAEVELAGLILEPGENAGAGSEGRGAVESEIRGAETLL